MCSLVGGVLLSLGDFADDAGVAGQCSLGLVERVGVRGHELSLVVGANQQIAQTNVSGQSGYYLTAAEAVIFDQNIIKSSKTVCDSCLII